MSEIDAAEWRKYAEKNGLSPADAAALLDALEKARGDHAEDRRLWTADMKALKAERDSARALRPAPSQSDEDRAREALARGRMATWPGYTAETNWENTDQENRDHWLSSVSERDVRSSATFAAIVRAEATLAGDAAELEACAKVLDDLADVNRRNGDLFAAGELDDAASTIRARKP